LNPAFVCKKEKGFLRGNTMAPVTTNKPGELKKKTRRGRGDRSGSGVFSGDVKGEERGAVKMKKPSNFSGRQHSGGRRKTRIGFAHL